MPQKENLDEKEVVKLQPSDLLAGFRNVKFHTFFVGTFYLLRKPTFFVFSKDVLYLIHQNTVF